MSTTRALLINGEVVTIEILELDRDRVVFKHGERTYEIEMVREVPQVIASKADAAIKNTAAKQEKGAPGEVTAPIPGLIVELCVGAGDTVEQGAVLLRLEAMKMQNPILAHASGIVTEVFVRKGSEVSDGELLLTISTS
jgi:biotin carboxyl carrier protein